MSHECLPLESSFDVPTLQRWANPQVVSMAAVELTTLAQRRDHAAVAEAAATAPRTAEGDAEFAGRSPGAVPWWLVVLVMASAEYRRFPGVVGLQQSDLSVSLAISTFRPSRQQLLRHVHTELVASKRNVWQNLQQQVSLVLMTLDFQYPALSEESFMQILHLTQLLMDEGDAFMASLPHLITSAGCLASTG
eukprot:Skav203959  [mRNA]  locus=scaffold1035:148851:158840:+ [translate_table: standard]